MLNQTQMKAFVNQQKRKEQEKVQLDQTVDQNIAQTLKDNKVVKTVQEGLALRYESNTGNTLIPTVFVNDASLLQPKMENGMFIANADSTHGAGTAALWNTNHQSLQHLLASEATDDYKLKLSSYARQYATGYQQYLDSVQAQTDAQAEATEIQKVWADPTSTEQVNSGADIVSNLGVLSGVPIIAIPRAVGALKTGMEQNGLQGAVTSLFKTVVADGADTLESAEEYIKNMVLSPFTTDTDATLLQEVLTLPKVIKSLTWDVVTGDNTQVQSTRSLQMLNNTLTSLGETMDYFLGGNVVKGAVQGTIGLTESGPIENIKRGLGQSNQIEGRQQFDWSTGNIVADIGLEILSDPSTWVTLGTSGAIKKLGKDGVQQVIKDVALKNGMDLPQETIEALAKKPLKTFIKTETTLSNAMTQTAPAIMKTKEGRVAIAKAVGVVDDVVTDGMVAQAGSMTSKLSASLISDLQEATKVYMGTRDYGLMNSLKSFRTSIDYLEQGAAQSAFALSSIGLGPTVVKMALKHGPKLGSFGIGKMNNLLKNLVDEPLTVGNFDKKALEIKANYTELASVAGVSPDEYVLPILADATLNVQKRDYSVINDIIHRNTNPSKAMESLNAWAVKQGDFKSIGDYIHALRNNVSVVPEKAKSMAQDIEHQITELYNKELTHSISTLLKHLPDDVVGLSEAHLNEYVSLLRRVQNTPVLNSNTALRDSIEEVVQSIKHPNGEPQAQLLAELKEALKEVKDTVRVNQYGTKEIHVFSDDSIAKPIYSNTDRRLALKDVIQAEIKGDAPLYDNIIIDTIEQATNKHNTVIGLSDLYDDQDSVISPLTVDLLQRTHKFITTGSPQQIKELAPAKDLIQQLIDGTFPLSKASDLQRLAELSDVGREYVGPLTALNNIVQQARINKLANAKFISETSLKSNVLQLKLSQVNALKQIMETPDLLNVMEQIRSKVGVGSFIELLDSEVFEGITLSTGTPLSKAVAKLQSTSESAYIATKLIQGIGNSETIPKALKNGLLDDLANQRNTYVDALQPNPEAFVRKLVSNAKSYVDYTNKAKPLMYDRHMNTPDTVLNVNNIASTIQSTPELDKQLRKVINGIENYEYIIEDHNITGIKLLREDGTVTEHGRTKKAFTDLPTDFTKQLKRDMCYSMSFAHGGIKEITFRAPDGTLTTFVRKNTPAMIDADSARKYYGMSMEQYKEAIDKLSNQKRDSHVFVLEDTDFNANIAMYLKQINMQDKIPLRLVGFNNANDTFGMDEELSKLLSKNKLKTFITYDGLINTDVYSISTVDAAQMYRMHSANLNTLEVSNEVYEELNRLFTNVGDYLDEANSSYKLTATPEPVTLMPNFGTETLETLRTITNILDKSLLDQEHLNIAKTVVEEYIKYNDGAPVYEVTERLLRNLGNTLYSINKQNAELGTQYIISEMLKKDTKFSNTSVLLKELAHGDGASPIAVRTISKPGYIEDWFRTITVKDMDAIKTYHDFAKTLNNHRRNILRPQIAMEFSESVQRRAMGILKNEAFQRGLIKGTYLQLFDDLKKLDRLQLITVNTWLFERLTTKVEWKDVMNLFENMDIDKYANTLGYSDSLLYGKFMTHTPGFEYLQSHYFSNEDVVMNVSQALHSIEDATAKAQDYDTELSIRNTMLDSTGYSDPDLYVRANGVRAYSKVYDDVRDTLDYAQDKYIKESTNATALKKAQAQAEYNKTLNDLVDSIDMTTKALNVNRIATIGSLSPEDYAKYLYKYALGKQIYKIDSVIFQEYGEQLGKYLANFSRTLKEAEAYGVRTQYNAKLKEVYIWLDNSVVDDAFRESAKDFKINAVNEIKGVSLTHMDDFNSYMDNTTGNAYSISTHSNFDAFQIEELNNYLKANGFDDVVDGAISKEYIAAHNLDTLAYNHTVIGDYGAGVSTIFSNKSTNLLTNMASGFHKTHKLLSTKDNYAALFFNAENSLRGFMNTQETTDYNLVRKALDRNNYVVCTYLNGNVVKLPTNSTRDIQEALRKNASILPYRVYTNSVERLNNNQLNNSVLRWLNKHYLSAVKVGQLLSGGWVLRNIPDSTLKGLVQAGDSEYITKLFETMELMRKYDTTTTMLYKETKGLLNETNTTKFFLSHADDGDILSDRLYRKMNDFQHSSSGQPTVVQEGLNNDLIKSLERRVHSDEPDEMLVTVDIEQFVKHVYGNPDATAEDLMKYAIETWGQERGVRMARLQYHIPKKKEATLSSMVVEGKYSPWRWIMEGNSKFETFIRMHTMLYWTEYQTGSVGRGYQMVDKSQFNRGTDSKARRITEQVMPFSSFAIDNMFYWLETFNGSNGTISNMINVLDGLYNPTETDASEMANNMSLQYMLLQGNIPISTLIPVDETGLNLKGGNSAFSAYQFLANPVGTLANMLHVTKDSVSTLLKLLQQSDGFDNYFSYIEDLEKKSYDNYTGEPYQEMTQEERDAVYTAIDKDDLLLAITNLIPVIGPIIQRRTGAIKKTSWADNILEFLLPQIWDDAGLYADRAGWSKDKATNLLTTVEPSVFSVTKMKDADTWKQYVPKPVGLQWYDQSEEYRQTHRYIPGISYVPSFLAKDPATYVNTYDRLLKMGYNREEVSEMMQDGWYIKDKSFMLINGNDYGKIPFWITEDSETYKRTQERLLKAGSTLEEARNLMIDGWYIAQNGDLVDRGEQNRIDANAWDQLKLFQQGLAPFPTEYVTQANRINAMGDGLSWEDAFYSRNGFAPSEMWLNPETGETYFKNSGAGRKGYSNAYPEYAHRRYNNSPRLNRGYRLPKGPRYRKSRAVNTRRKAKKYKFKPNINLPKTYSPTSWQGSSNIYKELYAKYGARRSDMMRYRGYSRSAITLFRESIQWDMVKQARAYKRS